MSKSESQKEGSYPITIRGKDYILPIRYLKHQELRFFNDNPRVYSAMHDGNGEPDQEDIQEYFQKADFVRELKDRIDENGGLMEPIYVREATMEVVEGNSRLAAYRLLSQSNPIKWNLVRCFLLPKEIDDSLIMSLLSQLHLNGKKDWVPYEQAALLHRRHKVQKVPIDKLKGECQISEVEIRRQISTIELMIEANDNQLSRWSYYYEFLKGSKIQKACKNHADLREEVIKRIKNGKIPKAADIRDKLKVVCSTDNAIKQFIAGSSLDHAFDYAQSSGGESKLLNRLNSFRNWVADSATKKQVQGVPKATREPLVHELKHIKRHVDALLKAAGK